MSTRRDDVADAAIRVIARSGLRGLTHRAVDTEVGLPAGSTSNCYRTRDALIEGAVRRMADLELAQLKALEGLPSEMVPAAAFSIWSSDGLDQTLVRLEMMIESVRNPTVRQILADHRHRFVEYAGQQESVPELPFTPAQIIALMAGVQFAEITTGEDIMSVLLALLSPAAEPSSNS
ncbi:TetR/AcrR family transcriptional regulator [Prescottella equi]